MVQLWQWWYLSKPPCNVSKCDQHMRVHLENRAWSHGSRACFPLLLVPCQIIGYFLNRSLIQSLALMCSAIRSSTTWILYILYNYLILHGFGLAGSSLIGYEDGTRVQPWRSEGEHMGPSGLIGLEQQCVKWSSECGQHVDIAVPHVHTAGDKELGRAWEQG